MKQFIMRKVSSCCSRDIRLINKINSFSPKTLASMAFTGCISMLFALAVNAELMLPSPPQLAASSYILVDLDSGKVIVEKNSLQSLPPASLTKMMTAYLASSELTKGNITPEEEVEISIKAWKMGGSKMFIREGTKVAVEDLLRGVIIQSGNDASVALAEHIAGDESAFAELMNQQARRLGMTNTHFENATGWPAKGHLTTARDLSMLAMALIRDHPAHYKIYSEREFTYNDITQSNRNGLLWRDQRVDGIKTGHTDEAGYCLVASAVKDDMRLISVLMGAKSSRSREQETQKLLSYGFRYFETRELYQAGAILNSPRVWAGEAEQFELILADSLVLTLPKEQIEMLEAKMEVDKNIVAPVTQGESYGVLKVMLEGEEVARSNLVAAQSVAEGGIVKRLSDQVVLYVYDLFGLN